MRSTSKGPRSHTARAALCRDDAERRLRVAGMGLDLEPDPEAVLRLPDRGPSRAGCSAGSRPDRLGRRQRFCHQHIIPVTPILLSTRSFRSRIRQSRAWHKAAGPASLLLTTVSCRISTRACACSITASDQPTAQFRSSRTARRTYIPTSTPLCASFCPGLARNPAIPTSAPPQKAPNTAALSSRAANHARRLRRFRLLKCC